MPGMFGGGGMSADELSRLAMQEAQLNRTNTWSPIYGGTTWTHGGGGGGGSTAGIQPWTPIDQAQQMAAGGGGGGGGDTWTQTQTLSPYMQQRFDLAQQLMGRVGGEMQPLDTSKLTDVSMDPNYEANQAEQAFKYSKGYLDPQWAMQEKQMRGQLAAQGLHPGDPGYNQAMTQFQTGRTQAYDQARAGSYGQGAQAGALRMQSRIGSLGAQLQEALQKSGWSLGQINALMQGLPGAPGGNASPVGLVGPALQQSMANQQMQAQLGSNIFGAGGLLGGAAIMASDENLKEDFADPAPAIEEFLESAEPAEYSYKPEAQWAGEGRHVSPMAQGLERSTIGRTMVVETPAGKMVDYGKSFGAVLASLAYLNKKMNSVMGL